MRGMERSGESVAAPGIHRTSMPAMWPSNQSLRIKVLCISAERVIVITELAPGARHTPPRHWKDLTFDPMT